jgi:hypothetical protein
MPPVPSVRGDRLVRALERAGFKVSRVAGSHHVMRHPDAALPSRCMQATTWRRARYVTFSPTQA